MLSACIEHTQKQVRYGFTSVGGKSCLLHRAVYAEVHGLDVHTMGGVIRHTCDNPKCYNAAHLVMGTQSVNILDMVAKGRGNPRRGERSPAARLPEDDVTAIRASSEKQQVLATRYGVRQSQISRIKGGTRWQSTK